LITSTNATLVLVTKLAIQHTTHTHTHKLLNLCRPFSLATTHATIFTKYRP